MKIGFKLLTIFIVLHSVESIEVQNGTVTSYDPSELLLKIFNPNNTVLPRQAGNGLRFEDDPQSGPSGPADEDQGQYGVTTFEDNTPLRFQDDPDPDGDGPIRPPSGPSGEDQGQYGLIIFDDNTPLRFQDDEPQNPGPNINRPINLQNSDTNVGRPVKFEESDIGNPSVNFQDDNKIANHNKRKRKRRRKPKRVPYQPGLGIPVVPGVPGVHGGSGVPGVYGNPGPYQGYGAGYGHPGLQGVRIKRPRRRRPQPSSLASDALTAVTGALTSIARYDDYQCVPRLLCEAAGGGALGSGGVLDSIAGLQPLLTLLSVYNGISSSPLFVFGRAVFLGMTSKGNTGTCRYAYAQCPTDPEQLIHYLNNHNGGFFRFFNAPPNQNLEQFYQHLGQNGLSQGQNYYLPDQNGLYQPSQNGPYQPGLNGPYQPGLNGPYQPGQNVYDPNQNYYQPSQNPGHNGPYPQNQFSNFGNPGIYPQKPSLYESQNYGQNYAYDYNNYGGKLRFRDMEKIEKRIQNKPAQEFVEDFNDFPNDDDNIENFDDDNNNVKWTFPESSGNISGISIPHSENNIRDSNSLKFPEDGQNTDYNKNSVNSNRKGKSFFFLNNNRGNQDNGVKYVNYNDYNKIKNPQSSTNRPIISNNYNNQNNNNYKPANNFNSNNYRPNKINNNYTPANNFNNNINNNYKPPNNYNNQNTNLNNNDYYYDHKHNFYVKKDNNPSNKVNDYNNYNNNYKLPNNYNNNNYKPSNNNNNYKPPNNNYNNQNNNFNNNDYYYDHKHNFYVKKDNNPSDKVNDYNNHNNNNYKRPNYYNNQNNNYYNNPSDKVYDGHNNGVNTVYVVRGNGDPNNPEIVKIRPGQSVY